MLLASTDIRLLALTSATRSCRSGWGGSAELSESAKPAGAAGADTVLDA